jgi:HAD superfamily hydrolase (TIGR01509 family)
MKAAIFDMDGLLVDSEPLWQEAEISVFRAIGVPLTKELCRQTTGIRLDGAVRHWYERFPWQGKSLEAVESQILDVVTNLIVERAKLLPGAREVVRILRAAQYELAVASSSPMCLIRVVLAKFAMIELFSVLHSADQEDEGKPNPTVYLSTMSRLGVNPRECIAFEDSVPGVRAAKAAGAWVIAVPAPGDVSDPGFADANEVLSSLEDFSLKISRTLI